MKILNPTTFGTIVEWVLREGDRQTYCNMYNANPHLAYAGFDVYLHPDTGQQNIDCDPDLSGFDTIVIREDDYVRVSLRNDELEFDPSHREALEYYFASMIAHISTTD